MKVGKVERRETLRRGDKGWRGGEKKRGATCGGCESLREAF